MAPCHVNEVLLLGAITSNGIFFTHTHVWSPLGFANASGGSYRTLATTLFYSLLFSPLLHCVELTVTPDKDNIANRPAPLRRFWLSFEDQALSLEDGVLVALVPSLCHTWATSLRKSDFPQGHGIALASMWHTSNYPNLEALGLGERVPFGQNVMSRGVQI